VSIVRAGGPKAPAPSRTTIARNFGNLPLSFEPNQGQSDPRVKFISRGHGYTMFLTPTEAVLVLTRPHPGSNFNAHSAGGPIGKPGPNGSPNSQVQQPTVDAIPVRMKLEGANPHARVEGVEQLPGRMNYFVGKDPGKWRSGIPTYAQVKYTRIYRGIDLVFYGNPTQFEYDFVVSPGARPDDIRLRFAGADKLVIADDGGVEISAAREKIDRGRFQQQSVHRRFQLLVRLPVDDHGGAADWARRMRCIRDQARRDQFSGCVFKHLWRFGL
jgi:hypothetical protein